MNYLKKHDSPFFLFHYQGDKQLEETLLGDKAYQDEDVQALGYQVVY